MATRMIAAALGTAALLYACAPERTPIFAPLSYRSELPRVSFYPRLVMPGKEVVVLARPMPAFTGETCLRIIDADAFAWHETCWVGGDSRRVTFRPVKPGRYIGYLAYGSDDGWLTTAKDKAELCVLGEESNCP